MREFVSGLEKKCYTDGKLAMITGLQHCEYLAIDLPYAIWDIGC